MNAMATVEAQMVEPLTRIGGSATGGDVEMTARAYRRLSPRIVVTARMIGMANRWEEPSAAMVRSLASAMAARAGMALSSARRVRSVTDIGWLYTFHAA